MYFDRPAFTEMMTLIKSGEVNCVITKDLSRFGVKILMNDQYSRETSLKIRSALNVRRFEPGFGGSQPPTRSKVDA